MVSKIQQQQVRQLITQTLTVLCQNSLPYNAVVTIEGLLGITIDHDDVFLVNIQQSIQRPMPPHSANAGQISLQYLRQAQQHAVNNQISTPLSQHSPHEVLHSPHGPISTPHSLPSPRGGLTSPQGIPQGVPHQGVPHQGVPHQGVPHQGIPHQVIPHGIPAAVMMKSPQRRGTPSPSPGLDLQSRKRPSVMTSRTPEPGLISINEPADLSMRTLRHRTSSRNRSLSPLAKVPRVSPVVQEVHSDVEKRVSMILQTAQAEMKAMEFNKRRHAHHYSRHKTEAPPDGYKKHQNHIIGHVTGHVTSEAPQMVIKVEPRSDSADRTSHVNVNALVQGINEKENYPEAWNILPELAAKWYKHNGRSPNDDVISRQGSDHDNNNEEIATESNDVTLESEASNDVITQSTAELSSESDIVTKSGDDITINPINDITPHSINEITTNSIDNITTNSIDNITTNSINDITNSNCDITNSSEQDLAANKDTLTENCTQNSQNNRTVDDCTISESTTVGTIVIVKQETEDKGKSQTIVSEERHSVAPSAEGDET